MGTHPTRARTLIAKLSLAAASLALSLCAAELFAAALRGNAYPFLNIFEASDRYGAALQPSAKTKVRSREGRITELATNSDGFRGPEWPEARTEDPVRG